MISCALPGSCSLWCLPRPLSTSILRPGVDLMAQYRDSLAGGTTAAGEAEATMFEGFLKDASYLASEATQASSLAMSMSMSIGGNDVDGVHSALSSRCASIRGCMYCRSLGAAVARPLSASKRRHCPQRSTSSHAIQHLYDPNRRRITSLCLSASLPLSVCLVSRLPLWSRSQTFRFRPGAEPRAGGEAHPQPAGGGLALVLLPL